VLRSVHNYLRHLLAGRPRGWWPLLSVYYLTYACDFRCPFCSDGAQNPYYTLKSKQLSGRGVLDLLKTVRRYCDHLVLTGGEPLKHPDVDEVLDGLPGVGFDGVVFTTNGFDLSRHLPAVARSVQWLVVSLETLQEDKADRWFGVGPGALRRILGNLEEAAALPGRRFEVVISSVATPDNLEDLHGVYDYCRQRGFTFALCPQLQGVKPHPALAGSEAYRRLYDRLIEGKRRGDAVNGTRCYLEHMRDLRKFDCRQSTVLAVAPSGDVFYPCLELGQVAGNLVETPDLHALRAEGLRRFGPEPACDNRCHSACALGFSLALNFPWTMVHEGGLTLRRLLRGRSP
jgi:MoaA/NifB/PqqE/SkfB family radical SAM enzyme